MYSFKEKKRHFSDLKNTSAAESDLLLLKSKVKQVISAWERQPKRYADDILYRLLDVATREEIRINRRERMKVHDAPSQKSDDNDVQKRISEAEAAREEAEERAEEAEAALEEAEERAEEAEAALEEEKKKEPNPESPTRKVGKSKSKKSTRK